jgi:hypothetical protein
MDKFLQDDFALAVDNMLAYLKGEIEGDENR